MTSKFSKNHLLKIALGFVVWILITFLGSILIFGLTGFAFTEHESNTVQCAFLWGGFMGIMCMQLGRFFIQMEGEGIKI